MQSRNLIDRLNELYRKSQTCPLSAPEIAERDELRREYLGMIRNQVKVSLEQFKENDQHSHQGHCCDDDCDCGHHH